MKVFFTGSPRALKTLYKEHKSIFDYIEKMGHQNLSKLVISADPDKFYGAGQDAIKNHYDETIKHLKEADIIVAEVSLHSMSMGYLVDKALELEKNVIVLHLPEHSPFFFTGIGNDRLQIIEYTLGTLHELLDEAFKFASENQDTRFNFFISPKIGNYLNWVSKKKRLPRAVYLRRLIEEDMKKTKEYKE